MGMLEHVQEKVQRRAIELLRGSGSLSLADLEIVLGEETAKQVMAELSPNAPNIKILCGMRVVIDTATPRLHSVRIRQDRHNERA